MAGRFLCAGALAASLLFFSCAGGRLKVPGEDMVRVRNEAVDAFSRAKRYETEEDYASAITAYEEAMAYEGLHDSAYYKIGRCYALSGKWEQARQVFNDIAAKDPANETICESLAYVYAMEGNYASALQLYEALVDETPYSASVLKSYIKVLAADGQKERATEEFSRFQSTFPTEMDSIKELNALLTAGKDD